MKFDDIIGQEDAKARLRQELDSGRVAHALMLCGPEGCGALPLAIAFAQELLTRADLTPEKEPSMGGLSFFGDGPSEHELRQRWQINWLILTCISSFLYISEQVARMLIVMIS